MIKTTITKNETKIAKSFGMKVYRVAGYVQETGKWNRKHAEFTIRFEDDKISLTVRTRLDFSKRFSVKNTKVFKVDEYQIDGKIQETVMNFVYRAHDEQVERERE